MSDETLKPKRTPVILSDTNSEKVEDSSEPRIITPYTDEPVIITPGQAPAFLQGIRPLDPVTELAKSPARIQDMFKHSFALWSQFSGVEVDGHIFNFDNHRYLLPIYMCEEKEMAWIKSAQMGATIYEVLRLLWFCRYHTVKAALYFPTADGVNKMSKDRLGPIIQSNAQLSKTIKSQEDSLGLKQIENIHGKKSSLYMMYLGGTASKDSIPLDILGFDEVRLCNDGDVDQALERISHSTYKYKMFVSTAGAPNCFSGETEVVVRNKKTKDISRIRMDNLVQNYKKYQVLSYSNRNGSSSTWKDISAAICRGLRPMVNVIFDTGEVETCTADHHFATSVEGYGFEFTPIGNIHRDKFSDNSGVLRVTSYAPSIMRNCYKEERGAWDSVTCTVTGMCSGCGSEVEDSDRVFDTDAIDLAIGQKEWIETVSVWANNNNIKINISPLGDVTLFNSRHSYSQLLKYSLTGVPKEILNSDCNSIAHYLIGFERFKKSVTLDWAKDLLYAYNRIGIAAQIELADIHGPKYVVNTLQNSVNKLPQNDLYRMGMRGLEDAGDQLAYDIQLEGEPWFVLAKSGALVHNSDIHRRFLYGTQQTWHVRCSCVDGFVPSDTFPDNIVDTGKEVYLRCPKCKMRINDPQCGNYVSHNPGGDYPSFQVSQFISKFTTPKEIWQAYNRTTNKQEFWNAKMGRPFIDEKNVPVTTALLESCINTDVKWLSQEERRKRKNCAMGVDQHGGNVYVVILNRSRDGKKQLAHLEVVESANPRYWEAGSPITPFKRLYELMKEYDVGMCICDHMPNYNEAMAFAQAHRGRVFLSFYGDGQKDVITWMDKLKMKESIKRGSRDIKLKYQCTINRYAGIDLALSMFSKREIDIPHPDALVQTIENEGRFDAEAICRTRFFKHLMSIVRRKSIIDEETGKFKMEWQYTGKDPHFVHALCYSYFAYERLRRQAILIM